MVLVATQQSQDKIENKTHFRAPQHKLWPVREVARAFETDLLHIIFYVEGDEVEVVRIQAVFVSRSQLLLNF